MSARLLDPAEKTTIAEDDILVGVDMANISGLPTDATFKARTLRDWIIASIPAVVVAASQYDTTPPENPFLGQVWFDAANGNKIMRWDGNDWIDVQRVIDTEDFGTGIKPVKIVNTLPLVGVSTLGDVAFLTSDSVLYRFDGTAWTKAVSAADLAGQITNTQIADDSISTPKLAASAVTTAKLDALAVTAAKIAAGAITAATVGTNEIIAVSANIKDGVVTNEKVANLDAGKITAGEMAAVFIAHSGGIYNTAYPGVHFQAVVPATGFNASGFAWGTGTGFGFTHDTAHAIRVKGPGVAGAYPIFNPDASGYMNINFFASIKAYTGVITVYYRKNGSGSYIAMAAGGTVSEEAALSGRRQIAALATDYFDFFVAPCDGNGDLGSSVTKQWALDMTFFNW